jgi:hypothetical protein
MYRKSRISFYKLLEFIYLYIDTFILKLLINDAFYSTVSEFFSSQLHVNQIRIALARCRKYENVKVCVGNTIYQAEVLSRAGTLVTRCNEGVAEHLK